MTSKERISATFQGKPTDRIPIQHIGFSSSVASQVLGREAYVGGGIQQWREAKAYWEGWHDEFLKRSFQDAMEISRVTEQDIVRLRYWRLDLKPTREIDKYTYLYEYGKEEEWKVLRYDPRSEQSAIFSFRPGERTLDDIKKQIKQMEKEVAEYKPKEKDFEFEIRARKNLGEQKPIRVMGVSIGIPEMEATIWLEAMLTDPQFVKQYINLQVEIARKNIEFLVKYGFRYFFGGRDFASDRGPMYSPSLFRELILPGLKKVSQICHEKGTYHLFASDGNLWPVADALFDESGIDGEYEVDRRAGMDLKKLRERYPSLVLIGNISSITLHLGTEQEVIKETLSCIKIAKEKGGIVVGASNYLVPGTPKRNLEAMLETINTYR